MKKEKFKEYQRLMNQKYDLEDRMAKIYNEKFELNNKNIKCGQQLKIVEDQIRLMFHRIRIELKKDKEESS